MTEDEMELAVKRAKRFNYTAFGILVVLLLCAGGLLLKYQYDHTFTTEKWLENPERRTLILQDLLTNHGLVGKTRTDVEALLGPGEDPTEFSGKLKEEASGDLLVYELGGNYMDDQWLVLRLKDDTVTSAVRDVT